MYVIMFHPKPQIALRQRTLFTPALEIRGAMILHRCRVFGYAQHPAQTRMGRPIHFHQPPAPAALKIPVRTATAHSIATGA